MLNILVGKKLLKCINPPSLRYLGQPFQRFNALTLQPAFTALRRAGILQKNYKRLSTSITTNIYQYPPISIIRFHASTHRRCDTSGSRFNALTLQPAFTALRRAGPSTSMFVRNQKVKDKNSNTAISIITNG